MGRSHYLQNMGLGLLMLGIFAPTQVRAQIFSPGEVLLPNESLPAQPAPVQSAPTKPPTPTTPQTVQPTPTPSPTPKPTERKKSADQFPQNPLDITESDPLLPASAGKRPLTPAERKQFIIDLDGLNTQADSQLKAGDRVGAFDTWNRELRLRRYLGPVAEVTALGRVGDIAWKENETPEVRWITDRLDKIRATTNTPTPGLGNNIALGKNEVVARIALPDALGAAYQQVRLPQAATEVYEQILTEARQRKDEKKIDATLLNLGQLYVNWFNYPKAAETYKQLLDRASARKDTANQIIYLNQLAYIYEQAKQPARTILYQQQLVNLYQQINNPKPIPGLRIKIAENYEQLSRLDLAERNYQTAYELSRPLLQLGYAADALKKLGALYLANNRFDAAIRVYNFLVGVEQQAYNTYGMMDAYDKIGQIYVTQRNYPQAIAAFQRGLNLARQLKYKEEYFTTQIQQISQR